MQVIDLNLSDRNTDPLILANYNGVEDTVSGSVANTLNCKS